MIQSFHEVGKDDDEEVKVRRICMAIFNNWGTTLRLKKKIIFFILILAQIKERKCFFFFLNDYGNRVELYKCSQHYNLYTNWIDFYFFSCLSCLNYSGMRKFGNPLQNL